MVPCIMIAQWLGVLAVEQAVNEFCAFCNVNINYMQCRITKTVVKSKLLLIIAFHS